MNKILTELEKSILDEYIGFLHNDMLEKNDNDPLDGDEVEMIVDYIRKELNKLNGNT